MIAEFIHILYLCTPEQCQVKRDGSFEHPKNMLKIMGKKNKSSFTLEIFVTL